MKRSTKWSLHKIC